MCRTEGSGPLPGPPRRRPAWLAIAMQSPVGVDRRTGPQELAAHLPRAAARYKYAALRRFQLACPTGSPAISEAEDGVVGLGDEAGARRSPSVGRYLTSPRSPAPAGRPVAPAPRHAHVAHPGGPRFVDRVTHRRALGAGASVSGEHVRPWTLRRPRAGNRSGSAGWRGRANGTRGASGSTIQHRVVRIERPLRWLPGRMAGVVRRLRCQGTLVGAHLAKRGHVKQHVWLTCRRLTSGLRLPGAWCRSTPSVCCPSPSRSRSRHGKGRWPCH